MPNLKCTNCGFVNLPEADICLRCKSLLTGEAAAPVYKWYVAYCALMALLYLLVVVLGVLFVVYEPTSRHRDAEEAKITGLVFIVMGLILFVPFAAGPFLPRRPWGWIFGLVLICIGLTSICCLPASIPLLISWLKPNNKAYFGKS